MGKLVDQPIPTLFGGISRQPSTVRRPNQLEESTNALSSVVTGGFEKRPGTQHIKVLSGLDITKDYAVHGIDRDATEQHFILLSAGSIFAFNAITGATETVTIADSKHYFHVEKKDIDSTGVITTVDSALFEQMAFDSGETAFSWNFLLSDTGTIFKVEGSKDNSVWNDLATGKTGASGSFTTTIGAVTSGDHNYIRINITNAASDSTKTITLSATFKDLTYLMAVTGPEDFAFVTVADHTFITNRLKTTRMQETATGTITSTHDTLTSLQGADPPSGDATIHRITGEDDSGFATFFVIDDAALSEYVETVDPTIPNTFDASRMPHELVRNSDSTFTFSSAAWKSRAAGNDIVNPEPKFVGAAIKDLVFWRDRLGLMADENVYLGESGDARDMWAKKATQALDTDPIDRAVSTAGVHILQWSSVFRKLMFITAERAQFEFSGGAEGLTPDNASLDLVTEYTSSANAKPETMGDILYFAATSPTASVVFEYFFDDATLSNSASDITKHAGDYVPKEIIKIITDPVSGSAYFLSTGEQNSLFVYKAFFDGRTKVQSAWGKYTFGTTEAKAFIHGMAVMSGFLVLVIERDDGNIYLEQMPVQREAPDATLGYIPLLDQRDILTGSYDSANDCTAWDLEWEDADDKAEIVLGSSYAEAGRVLAVKYPDRFTLTLATVVANETIILGGLTFTAHASTTTTANREFSISGNNTADAVELAVVINDATKGVSGVTATTSGAVVTLNVDDACDGTIAAPTGTAITSETIKAVEVDDRLAARGNFSTGASFLGRPYSMLGELSKIFLREAAADSANVGSAIITGRLQLKDITFAHEKTGYYKVTITALARDAVSYEFTGRVIGEVGNVIGEAPSVTGFFKVPVLSDASTVKIEITNDTAFPSVVTSASWRGSFIELTRQE